MSPFVKESSVILGDGDFHTAKQKAYIQSGYNTIGSFANGEEELSKPRKLSFKADAAHIQVSLDPNFETFEEYEASEGSFFEYSNPYADTTYYWRSLPSADDGDAKIYSIHTTSDCPRNIDLDGVTNVRDMGGYPSYLGGKIKQGLIYRGGRLTSNSTSRPQACLTNEGYRTMTEVLKLKSEIDLRYDKPLEGETEPENANMSDSFFPNVRYYPCPIDWHWESLMDDAANAIKDAFTVFGDPNNYPVYFHCSIGTDRTGLIAYLLGALLGMSNNDLYRDYLFSNFGNIGSSRTDWAPRHVYYERLQQYDGKNLSEKAKSYLLSIGVDKTRIKTIQENLLSLEG